MIEGPVVLNFKPSHGGLRVSQLIRTRGMTKSTSRPFIRRFVTDLIHSHMEEILSARVVHASFKGRLPRGTLCRRGAGASRRAAVIRGTRHAETAARPQSPFRIEEAIRFQSIRNPFRIVANSMSFIPGTTRDETGYPATCSAPPLLPQVEAVFHRVEARALACIEVTHRIENAPPVLRALLHVSRTACRTKSPTAESRTGVAAGFGDILNFCARCDLLWRAVCFRKRLNSVALSFFIGNLYNTAYYWNEARQRKSIHLNDFRPLKRFGWTFFIWFNFYASHHAAELQALERSRRPTFHDSRGGPFPTKAIPG